MALPTINKHPQRTTVRFAPLLLGLCLFLFVALLSACTDDKDSACVPQCDGLSCGPDSCGDVCGICRNDTQCRAGLCISANCKPDCDGKTCGQDGCGGTCGTCYGTTSCQNGSCQNGVCTPDCTDRSCGSDGCDGICGQCGAGFGCTSKGKCAAIVCKTQCEGRVCGANTCGGTCGTCAAKSLCNDSTGLCMPFRVTGTFLLQTRTIYFDRFQLPKFDLYVDIPAARVPLVLYDRLGLKIGETLVDESGHFEFQLDRLPIASDWISITPLWYHDNQLKLAILVANANNNRPFPIWSWSIRLSTYAQKNDPGDLGVVRIMINEGSGALYLFQQLRAAFDDLVDTGFEPLVRLPSVSAVWNNGITWTCGTCYVAEGPQEVGKETTESSFYIGGSTADESVWGYPTILHEFGHYVASLRRDDTPGGEHFVGRPSVPKLAWSEGFATFYALMMQSLRTKKPVYTYWRLLGAGSFWVDYSRLSGSISSAQPDPNQPMTQKLSESWVTYMLWDIWDGLDVEDPSSPADPIALGTQGLYDILKEKRYLYPFDSLITPPNLFRSLGGVDFVDFIDALICKRPEIREVLMQFVIDRHFPYDQNPQCFE